MSRLTQVAAGVGACALLVGTAAAPGGNGIEDEPAHVIAEKGRQSLLDARSLRWQGPAKDDTDTYAVDFRLDRKGNCVGTAVLAPNKGRVQIIKHGKDVWTKPDAALLAEQFSEGIATLVLRELNGRWLHLRLDDPEDAPAFVASCDVSYLQRRFMAKPFTEDDVAKGGKALVKGAPAITVTGRSGADRATLYVATEGKPLLLRIQGKIGGTQDGAYFSEYDKPVPSKTPSPAESVDESEFWKVKPAD
ncbi:hypothetical protein ABZ924_13800 [Streptomyces sp. NPDC046876]|uniref:hypothetical protein n=1 Tax=Streptomyces sp. NPDC046876 TaxID=3155616 RepID=UPI0034098CC4